MFLFGLLEGLHVFVFWPLLIIASLFDVIFLTRSAYNILDDDSRGSIAAFVWWTFLGLLILYVFGIFNVIEFVREEPGQAARWVGLYFAAGVGYMLVRGLNAVLKARDRCRERLKEEKPRFMERMKSSLDDPTTFNPNNYEQEWRNHVEETGMAKPIQVTQHKARIAAWIFLWLPDMAYQLVFRFVDRLADIFNFFWRLVRGSLQRAVNLIWRDPSRGI